MADQKAISLFELNRMIRQILNEGFPVTSWIIAEISELNENRSGHCYLELVDKNPLDDSIRAVSRATIWASRYRMIKPYFETTTGQALSSGIKVMVAVKVDFHERYGFSLNIIDIEPSFTIGELARRRIEILKKLEDDGVISMNHDLELALVPQKIAIISSETAAGYGDFIDQLNNNPAGYQYYTKLYQATMQGPEAGASIIQALDRVADQESFFDVVVIIRGGGAKTDLVSFDDYDLGYFITQLPLPVIAGIGHERDESVVDLVAHTSCKTPTAVAEFLIQQADYFSSDLEELKKGIVNSSRDKLQEQKELMVNLLQTVKLAGDNLIKEERMDLREIAIRGSASTGRFINKQKIHLNTEKNNFQSSAKRFMDFSRQILTKNLLHNRHAVQNIIRDENSRLNLLGKQADLLDPVIILKRGYSLTFSQGKLLKSAKDVKKGEELTTRLFDGELKSQVVSGKTNKKTKTD